ncbi:hypothetical protein CYY_004834 [Polysphondylium violaceum]|uniref:Uncharacterized protein n=1 Tax=Polysphondylium violaceum TaxID=133409 RepID=A0A8J4V7E6_9MYCE|nr:hypothetical protein CYY_004834 [Polysphondylium violaceum]
MMLGKVFTNTDRLYNIPQEWDVTDIESKEFDQFCLTSSNELNDNEKKIVPRVFIIQTKKPNQGKTTILMNALGKVENITFKYIFYFREDSILSDYRKLLQDIASQNPALGKSFFNCTDNQITEEFSKFASQLQDALFIYYFNSDKSINPFYNIPRLANIKYIFLKSESTPLDNEWRQDSKLCGSINVKCKKLPLNYRIPIPNISREFSIAITHTICKRNPIKVSEMINLMNQGISVKEFILKHRDQYKLLLFLNLIKKKNWTIFPLEVLPTLPIKYISKKFTLFNSDLLVSLTFNKNLETNQVLYKLNIFDGNDIKSRCLEKKDGFLKIFSKNKDSIVDSVVGTKIEIWTKKGASPMYQDIFLVINDPKYQLDFDLSFFINVKSEVKVIDNGNGIFNSSAIRSYIETEKSKLTFKSKTMNLNQFSIIYQPNFFSINSGPFISLIGYGVSKMGSNVSMFLSQFQKENHIDPVNSLNLNENFYNIGDVYFDLSSLFKGEKVCRIPIYSLYASFDGEPLTFEFISKKDTFLDLSGHYLGKLSGKIDLQNGNISEIDNITAYLEISGDINVFNTQKYILQNQSFSEIFNKD